MISQCQCLRHSLFVFRSLVLSLKSKNPCQMHLLLIHHKTWNLTSFERVSHQHYGKRPSRHHVGNLDHLHSWPFEMTYVTVTSRSEFHLTTFIHVSNLSSPLEVLLPLISDIFSCFIKPITTS